MTWVKICGITNLEDAKVAVDAGADALGFVFYQKSPRNIDPDLAREIIARLPGHVEKVGVFVDGAGFGPIDLARRVGLTAIQNTMRSAPTADFESQMMVAVGGFPKPPKFFWSFSAAWLIDDPGNIKRLAAKFAHLRKDGRPAKAEGCFDTFFLDSATAQEPGGTGTTFDWERIASIAEGMQATGLRLVVAGGLIATNVNEAMRILRPWGVDVSSGVEAKPGKKDPEKVRAFVTAVRQEDKKQRSA